MPEVTRKTAFVFAGGGSLGAVQVGMLRELTRAGVGADLVSGRLLGGGDKRRLFRGGSHIRRRGEARGDLARPAPQRRLPRDAAQHVGAARRPRQPHRPGQFAGIDRAPSPLRESGRCCDPRARDRDQSWGHAGLLSSGPAVEAILASGAIPAAFPSVRIGNDDLVDGAVGSNTPILTAARLGATRIFAFPTGFACALQAPPKGAIARALHAVTLLIAHQMVHDLKELAGSVEVLTVPSLCPLDASPYDFSHAGELIERSAERTRQWLDEGGLTRSEIPASLLPHAHGLVGGSIT